MRSSRLVGLVVVAAALAASAGPAGAATPRPPDPQVQSLQMPGSSTWGNLTTQACDGSAKDPSFGRA